MTNTFVSFGCNQGDYREMKSMIMYKLKTQNVCCATKINLKGDYCFASVFFVLILAPILVL